MDGILKALGFESKPDYTEKIPETLTPENFNVHNTFHHGFPHLPTCLDYDPVQHVLAVGSQNGRVLLLGKPGLERYITHPNSEHVLQMKFVSNKGLLVTMCDPQILYLWSLKEKIPSILHTLELTKERPTCMSHTFGSDWLYLGTDAGNVHVVHIKTFKISGFTIYWNHALEVSYRGSPGEVKSVEEHPMDQSKVLISFGCGYCVLYDLKCNSSQAVREARTDPHKRFWFEPGHSHVLTSTCWLGNGRSFVSAYSNGCVVQWNIKAENKPEKIFFVHETQDTTAFKPVYKIQAVYTDSEHPWYFCSGGFLEDNSEAPRTLSVLRGKSISMLSSSSTILDFLCLPSSPYPYQHQKPFALVILAKNELIFHDLLTPTFPKFDNSVLPYALDIHHPPVSSVYYCANCPGEFVAQLHSVRSKTIAAHTKPWPLMGGKWGQEVPHTSTDLILTGHTDGSVRLWHCSSVTLQPFFTIQTNTYFKMKYQPARVNLQSPPSGKKSASPKGIQKQSPPARPPPPSKPPPRSLKSQLSQPVGAVETGDTTESVVSKSTSHPQLSISVPDTEAESPDQRVNNTPSPATGQLRPETRDLLDGGEMTSGRTGSPDTERRTIFSREKKSIFKKKKNADSPVKPHDSNKLDVSFSGKDDKKVSPKLTKKSFKKVAKIVKLSGGVKKSHKKSEETKDEEVDDGEENGESGAEELTSPTHSHTVATSSDQQDISTSLQRPSDIALQQTSTTESAMTTPSSTASSTNSGSLQRSCSSSSDDFVHVPLPSSASSSDDSSKVSQTRSKVSQKTPTLPVLSETSETLTFPPPMFSAHQHSQAAEGEEEFFLINEMHICICGQWLCVSNAGGVVMAFDFHLKKKKAPKYLEVNFDSDSVVKQYVPGSTSTPKGSTSLSPVASPGPLSPDSCHWVFEDKPREVKSGFQLVQIVSCSTHSSSSGSKWIPVTISKMQYSTDMGVLVIGTNSGFAVVDTFNNSCLYTLSSLTSILYMADPTRFTRQMKRESQMNLNVTRKATIKRHATSMAFTVKVKEGQSPTKDIQSAKVFTTTPRTQSQPQFVAAAVKTEEEYDGMVTLSELDSCVSALEIVQLQLDKQSPPTLTLWAGLASGYVVAYGVNLMKGEEHDGSKKRIELVPTRFITETGKSPIVGLFFLNMWGDCQVVPYYPARTMSISSEDKLEYAIKGDRNLRAQQQKGQSSTNCPQHYAIIVDEAQIRSFSFPGFTKINSCTPPIPRESVILRSEYFSCKDLPCLMSVTSCHQLLVHSLPGLKPLMKMPFSPLHEAMVMCTFRVSGMGQALYFSSPSEIKRLSIVKEDRLNLPNCLPSLYDSVKNPPQTPTSKGLLGLFTSSPTLCDQNLLFGESARRPIGNLYKLDGKSGTVYTGRERDIKRSRDERKVESDHVAGPHEEDHISQRRAGNKGVSGQMERNVEALYLRKEKLSNIEKRTADVAENASEFASMAARLARKYEKR